MSNSPNTNRLLIVEDDKEQAEELVDYFDSHGFIAGIAHDGNQFHTLLSKNSYDLIIMDLDLPDADCLQFIQDLRKSSEIPIIMVTARSDLVDRVVCLELGADDYVIKPYAPRELLARVHVALRRHHCTPLNQADDPDQGKPIGFSGYRFDPEFRSLTAPDGLLVELTSTEYNLLVLFLSRPGRTLHRDFLTQRIFDRNWNPRDRSIDNLVMHLRKKIPRPTGSGENIKTVRSVGYVFADKITYL